MTEPLIGEGMETVIGTETESSLSIQIWDVLEKSEGREGVDPERKRRQLEILKKLPSDFEMEIRGASAYSNFGRAPLVGEIFENLVRADPYICPTPETEMAKRLRSAMSNPTRYQLKKFGFVYPVINPDIAQIDENTGIITGAIEIKAGRADNLRAKKQIREIAAVLDEFITRLKSVDDNELRAHGLEIIVDNKSKLKIAKNFSLTVVRSFGRSGKQGNTARKYKVVESPFSKMEIDAIADFVINQFSTKPYPQPVTLEA